ncbi:MAG: hypothetical protein HC913_14405, partial [Microscillaceae bacterium]|nr:hypothetical protein [Microscillaceae bacterium]
MSRKIIFLFIISLPFGEGWGGVQAQVIDSAFMAQHTYTDLKAALQNPEDVYGLDLSGQGLTEFPMEIFQFKNLRILNLGYNLKTEKRNNLKEIPAQIGELKGS